VKFCRLDFRDYLGPIKQSQPLKLKRSKSVFNVKLLFGSKTYETPLPKYKITSRNIKSRNLFLIKIYIF
jgi:hypothetical protein